MKRLSGAIWGIIIAALLFAGCTGSGGGALVTFSPANGAENQSLDVEVTVQFLGAVQDPGSWTGAFTLKKGGTGDTLCTDVAYDLATFKAICTHEALEPLTAYTATVTVRNLIGYVVSGSATFRTGTGSTPVDVSSLTDAVGTDIRPTGSTTVNPNSFTITFNQAMDVESVTASGNITMACGDLPVIITVLPASSDADDGLEDNEFTVSVDDAWKYALLNCTLTVTTAVRNVESDIAYVFANPCAVSDDFNADSQTCWPQFLDSLVGTETTWRSWSAILTAGAIAFDTVDSTLNYHDDIPTATANIFAFYKPVTISSAYQLEMHATSIDIRAADANAFGIALTNEEATEGFLIGFAGGGGSEEQQFLIVSSLSGWEPIIASIDRPASDCYLRLMGEGGKVTAAYSTDGITYTAFDPLDDVDLSGMGKLAFIGFGSLDGHDNRADVDSIVVQGVTTEGQY